MSETHQTITVFLNQLQYSRCGMGNAAMGFVYCAATVLGLCGVWSFAVTRKIGVRHSFWLFGGTAAAACLALALTRQAALSVGVDPAPPAVQQPVPAASGRDPEPPGPNGKPGHRPQYPRHAPRRHRRRDEPSLRSAGAIPPAPGLRLRRRPVRPEPGPSPFWLQGKIQPLTLSAGPGGGRPDGRPPFASQSPPTAGPTGAREMRSAGTQIKKEKNGGILFKIAHNMNKMLYICKY